MADEPLGRMVIELGLDHSDFGKGLAGVKKETKYAMAELKSSMSVAKMSGKEFDVLSAKATGLSKVMMSQERQVQALGKAYKNSLVDGKASKSTAKLATELQNANAKLMSLRTQYINNAGALAKVRAETTGYTGQLNKMSKAAVTVGTSMSNIGSKMTTKVSMPIAAGLAYATKSAVKFDSQIKAIGPLLTNGATVTSKYKAQLDQLGDASKSMSEKYGVSTTEINNGMTELIRRGYNTNQVLGSMPSIMDATMASGEDLGSVLNTTSSIVEQFGLKSKSTAGTLKNTQMVTDSITYAANATAAGFSDMGEAMSYVGPQAHAAGLSVQETAAAIGELSNKGIEGQKAGTNLRGILTSLVKVTPNASKAFSSMGISAGELKKDANDLPRLIDDITKGTKGWDKADRNKAIATAFGRENQSAMNALLETGSSKLRQLTKDTEDSTGATKKQAEEMSNTSENNVKKLLASLQVLGIEVGAKLVPKLIPLVNKAKDLVDGFSDLDDSTQNTIIKFALLAAAGGPVLAMTGKLIGGFGKVGGSIVTAVGKYAEWKAKTQATKEVLGDVATGATTAGKEVEGLATKASVAGKGGLSIFGTALTTTEAGAGVLGTSLTVAGAAVTGVGVAALVGAGYWELYGKKAYESSQRVREWGSDIGKDASDAAQSMQNFETTASNALSNTGKSASDNAKIIDQAFKDMTKSAKDFSDKQYKDEVKSAKSIGGVAEEAIKKQAKIERQERQKSISDMESNQKQVERITKNSRDKNVKLTEDQATQIHNLQLKTATDQVKTLGLSQKQERDVIKAEMNETANMSKEQIKNSYDSIAQTRKKYNAQAEDDKKAIRADDELSEKEKNVAIEAVNKQHFDKLSSLSAGYIAVAKKDGKTMKQIRKDLETANGEKVANEAFKIYEENVRKTTGIAIKETSDMSKSTKKAAESWNKMVLDPKTGKVKTNAQEEVDKAVKNKDKWNSMMLLVKEGKMSTNAASMIGIAAVNAGEWDKLTLKEKKALIATKGGDDLAAMIEKGKEWNKFTPAEKKAIISAKGKFDLLNALSNLKTWNKLSVKEKKAVLKDNASPAMKQAKIGLNQWNNLTPHMKTVVAKAKGASDVAKGVKNVKDWNSLPTKEKNLIANDKNASQIVGKVTNDYKKYISLPKSEVKSLLAKDNASKPANNAKIAVDKYGRIKMPNPIGLKATDKASGPAKTAKKNVKDFGNSKPKSVSLTAKNNTNSGVNSSKTSVKGFTSMNGKKPLTTANNTKSGVTSSKGTVNGFMKMPSNKSITASNKTSGGVTSAKRSIDSVKGKEVTITALFKAVKSGAAKLWHSIGFEKGTSNFQGGSALVNDQAGPVYREAIKIPGRRAFVPEGRNVVIEDLPRGSQIIPARLTANMIKGQKLVSPTIPESSSIIKASDSISESVAPQSTVINTVSDSDQKLVKALGDKFDTMSSTFGELLAINRAQLQAVMRQGSFDVDGLYRKEAKDLSLSMYGPSS
jgi:TP901 family phage tail tape measure protein